MHVLRSPRWPRSVRLFSRDFRDWKRCSQAIYDQVGVEVDFPRGHWKRWWPSLAAQLLKTVEVVGDSQRHARWIAWAFEKVEAAPCLSHRPADGSPYKAITGGTLVDADWAVEQAIRDGLIEDVDEDAFRSWLGPAEKNRRDAKGVQKKLIALPAKPPLVIRPSRDGDEQIEVAGSGAADDAENKG
jgi:hypothetical protein